MRDEKCEYGEKEKINCYLLIYAHNFIVIVFTIESGVMLSLLRFYVIA